MNGARVGLPPSGQLRSKLAAFEWRRRMVGVLLVVSASPAALGAGACLVSFESPQKVAELSGGRFTPSEAGIAGILLLACAAVVYSRVYLVRRDRLLDDFKTEIVAPLLEEAVAGARYLQRRHIAREVFKGSRLFEGDVPGERVEDVKGDRFWGDDLIQGTVGETPFECSELHVEVAVERYAQEKTRTEFVDVFQGLFVRVDLDRDLSGHTIVESKAAKRWDRSGYAAAQTGGVFGERFNVFSTAPEETLELLTSGVRERLVIFADRAAAPIRVALWGRVAVGAIEFGRHLFDLEALAAAPKSDPASLARPVELAAEFIRVLGLDSGRRRPADPDFPGNGSSARTAATLSWRHD